jgi:putative FmdB family regulatory protein
MDYHLILKSMPIYEYICKHCETQFEALVTGNTKPHCPECDSLRLEQQYSSFSVGAPKGKGQFSKSASSSRKSGCGTCGDPRGPGSCAIN